MNSQTHAQIPWGMLAAAAAGVVLALTLVWIHPGLLGLEPRTVEVAEPVHKLTWSDLVANDTAVFAANLRAVGCPEETIRRIVTRGDFRSETAAAPVVEPATAVPAPTPAAVPVAVQAWQPPAPVAAQQETVIVAPEGRVPLPVVFQSLPQDAQMTNTQRALLNSIQDEFIAAIGGPNQNPSAPDYQDRWRQAQRKSDELFKVAFGETAFMRRQMAVLRSEDSSTP